ncbi:hypothetical protein [uncultured Pontibacter sp.]|uniref:hypothetical protein n=1 Tax=uncultured Pontibacter sp. TaxID=453356 RepID=UPI0026310FE3|nr:hypothetical protein [uncultured Pontibacter sp.]
MKTQALPLLLLFALLSFSSCKKKDANPKEVLPAATMEGKNTFGAMVNGKVWLPKGRPSLFRSNFIVTYDPGYKGGTLNVSAYRKANENSPESAMVMGMTQVDHEGVYTFDDVELSGVRYYNGICEYDDAPDFYQRGKLEVTKLDLVNGIIAGKFELTLAITGCDTIRINEGRFDKRIF